MNENGQVVGTSATPAGEAHAFLWRAANGMADLGTLGGTESFGSAISNTGQIVGSGYTDGNATTHAFSWTAADGLVDLGAPGGIGSSARRRLMTGSWSSAPATISGGPLMRSDSPTGRCRALDTRFIAGASAAPQDVWLRLAREPGNQITGAYSSDGVTWTSLGTVVVPFSADEILAGLAVTSHRSDALYAVQFDHVSVSGPLEPNLLVNGDFEAYDPPALGPPGWISDHEFRQSPAKSETHQPLSGLRNGACWTTEYLDCGIYQDVVAPATGTYTYTVYATADRAGGLVGANLNGLLAASRDVTAASFGVYSRYTMTVTASGGDVIRVWMYSPASPGYVVIDDASLVLAGE